MAPSVPGCAQPSFPVRSSGVPVSRRRSRRPGSISSPMTWSRWPTFCDRSAGLTNPLNQRGIQRSESLEEEQSNRGAVMRLSFRSARRERLDKRQGRSTSAGVLVMTAALAGAALVPAATPATALAAGNHGASAHHGLAATIRRTTGGVPHILAHNWTSLGFGYGFAFAQDNICTMANDYVTVEAQRSRYFGPKRVYTQGGNGATSTNLDSDLFWQQIIDSGSVTKLTRGIRPQLAQMLTGYVDGYNHYLASVGGAKGVPDPTCQGRAWVKPITTLDAELRFYQLMLLSGEGTVIDAIAQAAPPKPGARATALVLADPRRAARLLAARLRAGHDEPGSNAVAIGSQGTRNHHGLLLGNPHFPWSGTERFYQAQLTIPGEIDVTGASLYGVPLILIGHNSLVAWSHTVSTAFRFTPYQLTLVAKHPTEYLVNGHPVAMSAHRVTIMIGRAGGKLVPFTRTLYTTRYGPIITSLAGISLPWNGSSAYAIRDVNAANLSRAMDTWFGIDRAKSTGEVLSIIKKYQGIPWVNTVAADRQGQALYADIGAIPGVPDKLALKCDTPFGSLTFAAAGLPILDGSRIACNWATGPHAAANGLLGPNQEPSL